MRRKPKLSGNQACLASMSSVLAGESAWNEALQRLKHEPIHHLDPVVLAGIPLLAPGYSCPGAFPCGLADFSAVAIGRHYLGGSVRVFTRAALPSGPPPARARKTAGVSSRPEWSSR